ncbi:MAG: sugar phosphate isomerase/epimerase [Defluviitaleaceae bacterium]|nr:sugar phosphate isomerase/epimerase [Defluviitaleaceae bacterium]
MRYGYCMDLKFLNGDEEDRALFEAVVEAGFDYIELPFSELSALSRDEIADLKKELRTIPCLACNLFFPPGIKIVGPGMAANEVMSYLERMMPLAAGLGIETLVFGNGGARKIPEGATRESIWANLRLIAELMDVYAVQNNIKISVEPLNSTETNIINSYGEAVELTFGLKNVGTMIDSYHVAMENQTYEDVAKYPAHMWHLHTAYPTGRLVPSPDDPAGTYDEFVQTVKKSGYNNKISIEGALKNPADVKKEVAAGLEVLRGWF